MGERTGALDDENEVLELRITTERVVLWTLALVTTFAATVGLERLGVSLPVVREVLAVILLTVVPGYLLVRLVGLTPRYRVETLLYTVGLSIAALMAIGVIANFALRAVDVADLCETLDRPGHRPPTHPV